MTEKKVPVYLGEGENRIQIGEAVVQPWVHGDGKFTHVTIDLDVFPGERATLSRVANWDEMKAYSERHYPEGEK